MIRPLHLQLSQQLLTNTLCHPHSSLSCPGLFEKMCSVLISDLWVSCEVCPSMGCVAAGKELLIQGIWATFAFLGLTPHSQGTA